MVSGHKKHVKQLLFAEGKVNTNLVPRSHSVNGNVRSGKVRHYTLFHWLLKKGCGNAIYALICLFRGTLASVKVK